MSVLVIVVLAIAVWRLSNMLVFEWGPFGVFEGIRRLAGIRHSRDGQPITWSHRNLLNCVWCTSVWVAIGVFACWWFWPSQTFWACVVLVWSAAACWLDLMREFVNNLPRAIAGSSGHHG